MADNSLKAQAHVEKHQTGIEPTDTSALAEGLSQALADTFSLYVKTQGVHWNVVGPNFYGLHKLTEAQYEDLQEAIDLIAERIRALGHPTPAGFSEFRERSIVKAEMRIESAGEMIQELISDNENVARRMRDFSDVAADARDKYSEDLLIQRIGAHEKNAWMLRALMAN